MNFFKLYIGDYQRDTGTLTLAEHGAYLLMLQHYYATEGPLPTGRELHRLLRAESKSERDAIDTVAARFWTPTDSGLINQRADEEIAKGRAQAETNRAIAKQREERRRATKGGTKEQRTEYESCSTREPNHSHSQNKEHSVPNGTGVPPPGEAGREPSKPDGFEPDPVKDLFDLGVAILTRAGRSEREARSLIGRLRKDRSDEEAASILVSAKSSTDPAAYIAKAMQPKPRRVQLC